MRIRSSGGRAARSRATSSVTQSRMLAWVRRRRARSSGVPPAPKSWSNATRGSRVMGSGSVGEAQLMESVYAQAYPYEAAARLVHVLDAELHGGNRGLLAETLGEQLVHGSADEDVGSLGPPRVRLGEEGGAGPEVVGADFLRGEGLRLPHIGVADDGQAILEALQRLERARAQIEAATELRGSPQVLGRAPLVAPRGSVRVLDGDEARLSALRLATSPQSLRAGIMLSRRGSASAAPEPRRKVRRGMWVPVMNFMSCSCR